MRVEKFFVGADAYIGPFADVTNMLKMDNNNCFSLWGDVPQLPSTIRKNHFFDSLKARTQVRALF